MKKKSLLAIFGILLGGMTAQAQSTYTYTPGDELDNWLTPTGGSGVVTFTLTSGTAVPGLGASYTVPLTFLDSSPSGSWDNAGAGANGLTGAAYSMDQADAFGALQFGGFPIVSGYGETWDVLAISFLSPSPGLTSDTLDYTGLDSVVSSTSGTIYSGTPDDFLYTEGTNPQSAFSGTFRVTYSAVPEPSSGVLALLAGSLLLCKRRR